MKKKNIIAVLIAIIIVISACTGGYFLGAGITDAKYNAEREYSIRLAGSDLEGLGEIEGTIFVTGHKSPDSDTICCSIAYAALMRKLGYDAKPVVLGRVNNESRYILKTTGTDEPELLENASGLNMILVDHSEYPQSADGLNDANVIGIIDHHGIGDVTTSKPIIYDARPLGAASTIVWLRYREYGVEIDKQTAHLLLGGILSDTNCLESSNTTFADREGAKVLSEIAAVDDINAFYSEMHREALSFEGMTDAEIYYNDYKEYETAGVRYAVASLQALDENSAKELIIKMRNVIPSEIISTGMDMVFVKITYDVGDDPVNYLLVSDADAAEIAGKTDLKKLNMVEDDLFTFKGKSSRKSVLVPAIDKVLNSYFDEKN